MKFDVPNLARGWLSVAQASANDKDLPTLHRTIALEVFPNGLRLVATDRYILLSAWVPDLGDTDEPELSILPDRVVVAQDADGRCKGLLAYMLAVQARMEKERDRQLQWGELVATIDFDVRLPEGIDPQETLEGLEPTFAVIEVPDMERVWLPVIESMYPDWRGIVGGHVPIAAGAALASGLGSSGPGVASCVSCTFCPSSPHLAMSSGVQGRGLFWSIWTHSRIQASRGEMPFFSASAAHLSSSGVVLSATAFTKAASALRNAISWARSARSSACQQ